MSKECEVCGKKLTWTDLMFQFYLYLGDKPPRERCIAHEEREQ